MRKTLHDKIKGLLEKYGHTQNDLAELIGKSYQSISLKINRKSDFTLSELRKIAFCYNMTPEEFFDIFIRID